LYNAGQYPLAQTIHLVVDNLSTHSLKILVDRFGPEQGAALWKRFTVHYTPKHASWLNQASQWPDGPRSDRDSRPSPTDSCSVR
jgi:hypothetical protein